MSAVVVTGAKGSNRPLIRHGYWNLVPRMAKEDVRAKYRQSTLHLAWAVVQPAILIGIFAYFFHGVLKIDGDNLPYLSFVVCGLVPWRYFASAISDTSSISDNLNLISKVYFPREVVPLVRVVAAMVDFGIGMIILVGVCWAQGHPPTMYLIALPLVLVLLLAVTVTVAVVTTVLAVFVRDLSHAMPLLLQAGFFATPIMYPASQVPTALQWMVNVNPMSVVATAMRNIFLSGTFPTWSLLLGQIAIWIPLAFASLAYSRSVEHRMVDLA